MERAGLELLANGALNAGDALAVLRDPAAVLVGYSDVSSAFRRLGVGAAGAVSGREQGASVDLPAGPTRPLSATQ
jgi:hypothetical protein